MASSWRNLERWPDDQSRNLGWRKNVMCWSRCCSRRADGRSLCSSVTVSGPRSALLVSIFGLIHGLLVSLIGQPAVPASDLSPHGRPLPFQLVRFAGRNCLRSELYGAITLALGQYVVPGNQLLLRPNRGNRGPGECQASQRRHQLILSVSRQAKHRRRRGDPAKEQPTLTSQFIYVHSHGILHSLALRMATGPSSSRHNGDPGAPRYLADSNGDSNSSDR